MASEESRKRRKKRKNKNAAVTVLIVLLSILVILLGVALFILTRSKPEEPVDTNFDITFAPEPDEIGETQDPNAIEIDSDKADEQLGAVDTNLTKDEGWIHYLMLGVDGESNSFSGKRSDAMIVVSMNKDKGKIIMSSIPRDTLVYIDGKGFDKLTHAYAYGGADLTVKTFEENFDIDVEGYVTINFKGMVDVVDTLGGLTLTLTDAEAKHMGEYYAAWGLEGGTQLLNGKEVLAYCRVRKIDSDYVRNDRQFRVIKTIYEKVKKMPVTKYPELITKLYDDVYTNIKLTDLISLATAGMDILDGGELVNEKLLDSSSSHSGRINGKSFVLINDLVQMVTDWRERALGITDYEPSARVKQIAEQLKKLY